MKGKVNYTLLNILLLMLVLYLGVSTIGTWGAIVFKIIGMLTPFIVAFAIAYALYPFVRFLEKKGVRHSLAVTVVTVAVFAFLVGLLWITLPLVYDQLVSFSKTIIEVIQDLSMKLDINLGDFQTSVTDTLNDLIKNLGDVVSNGTINLVGQSISLITNTIVVLIVSIYFLADMQKIRHAISVFLFKLKKRAHRYVKALDQELGKYLNGLALFMVIQLFEYCLLFFIAGHPNWLLLGILACVTTVIPYFGGLITNVIAIITATVISPALVIKTLIICLIFPQVDGYIISPKIYGKTNNINPLCAILAVSIGGSLGGFIGIVIALPVFILLSCTYRFFKSDIKDKVEEVKNTTKKSKKKANPSK